MTSSDSSCSANSNSVTMPKLPPPPRNAQNSSACSSADARRISPSAVTTSRGQQAVDGQAVAAHQAADAAAEREAARAGVRDDASRQHQAVLLSGAVDFAEQRPAADYRSFALAGPPGPG